MNECKPTGVPPVWSMDERTRRMTPRVTLYEQNKTFSLVIYWLEKVPTSCQITCWELNSLVCVLNYRPTFSKVKDSNVKIHQTFVLLVPSDPSLVCCNKHSWFEEFLFVLVAISVSLHQLTVFCVKGLMSCSFEALRLSFDLFLGPVGFKPSETIAVFSSRFRSGICRARPTCEV